MPRLIDADIFYDNIVEGTDLGAEDNVDEALKRYLDLEPTVEAIPKADYEARLKADKIAMLEELKKEIEELDFFEGEKPINITQELMDEVKSWEYGVKDYSKLIQEKINLLKENEDGKTN